MYHVVDQGLLDAPRLFESRTDFGTSQSGRQRVLADADLLFTIVDFGFAVGHGADDDGERLVLGGHQVARLDDFGGAEGGADFATAHR